MTKNHRAYIWAVALSASLSWVLGHASENLTWESTKQDRKAWKFTPPSAPDAAEEKKVALGRRLYFEPALSKDHSISCASCHVPDKGFADPSRFSKGVDSKVGARQAQSILNCATNTIFFWDGRAKTLEDQALQPIINPLEMNVSLETVVKRLRDMPDYVSAFKNCFDSAPTAELLAQAIATYEKQVYSFNSPFDKWVAGDESAIGADAKKGFALFVGKADCNKCHLGPNFTDGKFHNLGIGMDKPKPDLGRFIVTKIQTDKGAFKTPGLREIVVTAPYLHDGSAATLEEVIETYDKGGVPNPWLSPLMKQLKLTADEKKQLVEFMKALSGQINDPIK